jgi:hypothetical protein
MPSRGDRFSGSGFRIEGAKNTNCLVCDALAGVFFRSVGRWVSPIGQWVSPNLFLICFESRFRSVLEVADVARLRSRRPRFPNSGESGYKNASQRCLWAWSRLAGRERFTAISLQTGGAAGLCDQPNERHWCAGEMPRSRVLSWLRTVGIVCTFRPIG